MYRIIAILLLLIFYGIYYGKLISQKKNGIQTNQIKNQGKGIQYRIGILMSLATVLAPVAEITSICLNISVMPTFIRNLGVILASLGDLIFLLSVKTMGNSWRAGVSQTEKTKLITVGIYSISRNPAFLAFDFVYIGILMMFFSWWHMIFSIFAIIMLHLQITKVEEPFLPTAFGEEYLNYRKRVLRYLGRKL